MSSIVGVFHSRLLMLLALACVSMLAIPAEAQSLRDVYTVSGVPVDATAASSQIARDQAIGQGQRRAIRLLLERLALRRDHPRLPQVSAADLTNMVEGFEVSNERTSAVRYLADLSVTFKPVAVRALMAQAGIPIAETPSGLTLVLPVWRGPQGLQLFSDTNPWRDAWIRIATGKGLVPLTTPLGDATDLGLISAEQAVNGNPAALAAIARQYNVTQVIVAQASGDAKGETIDQLVVTRYAIGGERSIVNASPRRPPEALLATALGISQEVEETWKANVVSAPPGVPSPNGANPPVAGGDVGGPTLNVQVPVRQLGEWLAIKKRLGDVTLVKKVDVSSLGVDGASIVITYVGGEQQLQSALAQVDLLLSNDGGNWILRARPSAVMTAPTSPPATGPTPPATPVAAPSAPPSAPPANAPSAAPAPAPSGSALPPVTTAPTTIGPAPGTTPGAVR